MRWFFCQMDAKGDINGINGKEVWALRPIILDKRFLTTFIYVPPNESLRWLIFCWDGFIPYWVWG